MYRPRELGGRVSHQTNEGPLYQYTLLYADSQIRWSRRTVSPGM